MKRRIILIALSLMLVMSMMPAASFAATSLPDLSDKGIYYTPDYRSGDCILSSCKCMMRRAAIIRGSSKWDTITNTNLRKSATIFGRLFRNSFTYKNDGITYKVVNQELRGDYNTKLRDITALLKNHPEGVIVWGRRAARTGPHAVLVTGVKNGVVYAADSTHNSRGTSVGIQVWSRTTMKSLSMLSDAWYLSSISGGAKVPAATGASTLSAICVSQPETIKAGRGFGVSGSIQSNYRIKGVTVSIINAAGKVVISKSAKPGSCAYSLSEMDSSIKFGTLMPGKYKYRISAADEKKGTTVLHENSFSVTGKVTAVKTAAAATTVSTAAGTSSSLKGVSIRLPGTIKQGRGFSVMGKVTSNKKITNVTASVVDGSGKTAISASANPNSKSFNLTRIDAKLKFGTLASGSYRYVVTATDQSQTLTLADHKFEVKGTSAVSSKASSSTSAASSDSDMSISSVRAPKALKVGGKFTIIGKIKSSVKIREVKVQVVDTNGHAVLSVGSKPGKKSYNIKKLDARIKFGTLKAGSYSFVVQADNGSGWQTLVDNPFSVK